MAIDVTAEIWINRARDDVATYVIDPQNDPAWISGITEARLVGAPPLVEGAQVERVARFLGRRIHYINEVDRLVPGERLEMHAVAGPFPMTVHYAFTTEAGGTHVAVRNQGSGGRFFRLADRLLAPMVRRQVQGDLRALKQVLETPTASVG